MTEDRYQILEKSQYMTLLLLNDELQYFDEVLSEEIRDISGWLSKLRATRSVFLALHNLKEVSERIQLKGDSGFVAKTRKLRKGLIFANHFRNRGVGHLNDTLMRRAAQWHPQVFLDGVQTDEQLQTVEAQRAVIESCINSFVDKDGKQKNFGTEIDLMYPPDAKQFYEYLAAQVKEAKEWLTEAIAILGASIKYHSTEQVKELAAIAGQTNFDLKEESDITYSEDVVKERLANLLRALEKQGVDPKIIEFLNNGGKI
jgi:hypothetical protein